MTAEEIAYITDPWLVGLMHDAKEYFESLGYALTRAGDAKHHGYATYLAEFGHPKRAHKRKLRLQLMVVEAQEHGSPAERMLPELRPEEKIQFWAAVYDLETPKGDPVSYETQYFVPDHPEIVARQLAEFTEGWYTFLSKATRLRKRR